MWFNMKSNLIQTQKSGDQLRMFQTTDYKMLLIEVTNMKIMKLGEQMNT